MRRRPRRTYRERWTRSSPGSTARRPAARTPYRLSRGPEQPITDWLAWFAGIALEAQARTRTQVEFLIDKTKLLDRVRNELNERQLKVLLRLLREGPAGFEGGLSAGNYVTIAKTSTATATRDLADMAAKGALTRTGERRYTRYHLPIPLRPVSTVTIDEDGNVHRC